jgi:hypothetical protein
MQTHFENSGINQKEAQRKIEKQLKTITLEMFKRTLPAGDIHTNIDKVCVKNSASIVWLPDVPVRIMKKYKNGNCSLSSLVEGESYVSRLVQDTVRINTGGIETYILAGRIQSPTVLMSMKSFLSVKGTNGFVFSDAGIAAFKKDCETNKRTFTLSKKKEKYDGDYSAHILEVNEKGELRERFWIDSDRGYICLVRLQ